MAIPTNTPDFDRLAAKWPSPFVTRQKLSESSGGILNPRTMANRDCRGGGIPGRFRIGKTVAYPVESVIEFLKQHLS